MPEAEKQCRKCKKWKPATGEYFYAGKGYTDGLRAQCKSCYRARQRNRYDEMDDEEMQHLVTRQRAHQLKFIERQMTRVVAYLLEHPCVDCGEADPIVLDFDHRDPSEKVASVCHLLNKRRPWKAVKAEIEKCDVRCANCHRRKTATEAGHMRWQIVEGAAL